MGKNAEDLKTIQIILKDLVLNNKEINFKNIQEHPLFKDVHCKEKFTEKHYRMEANTVTANTMINGSGNIIISIKGLKLKIQEHSVVKYYYESFLQDFIQNLIKLQYSSDENAEIKTSNLSKWFESNFGKN